MHQASNTVHLSLRWSQITGYFLLLKSHYCFRYDSLDISSSQLYCICVHLSPAPSSQEQTVTKLYLKVKDSCQSKASTGTGIMHQGVNHESYHCRIWSLLYITDLCFSVCWSLWPSGQNILVAAYLCVINYLYPPTQICSTLWSGPKLMRTTANI